MALAADQADALACGSEPGQAGGLTCLVTLDQAAASVHMSKRTLEREKTRGHLPAPTVEGGGGKADKWDWSVMRPWLTATYGVELPTVFPANRYECRSANRH